MGVALLAAGAIGVYSAVCRGAPVKAPESSPSVLMLGRPPEERFAVAVKVDDRKLAPPSRSKQALECREIDGMVDDSVLLIMQAP